MPLKNKESTDNFPLQEPYFGKEDCVYIHVHVPESLFLSEEIPAIPVMAFVHGGGFQIDSRALGPDYFMDAENVILVTMAYRLGPLGFLSTETGDIEGNMGVRDLIESLKWVKANIASFKGDPNQVTLFGGSAGGKLVMYLKMSPLA